MGAKVWAVPLRAAAGAFILNSGLQKRHADRARAEQLHGFASGAYPELGELEPEEFANTLSTAEIALGSALLLPMVPTFVAGAALTAFASGLVGLYWRTPGMHEEHSPVPTDQGIPLAKDSWLLAIGLALVLGSILPGRRRS
ncbi:MAG TPA: hypothetical protein VFC99_14880 [Acidimicrobiia bacterium]|nr:hypothetical protein [Acidimicrobiia bacterium]